VAGVEQRVQVRAVGQPAHEPKVEIVVANKPFVCLCPCTRYGIRARVQGRKRAGQSGREVSRKMHVQAHTHTHTHTHTPVRLLSSLSAGKSMGSMTSSLPSASSVPWSGTCSPWPLRA
jgi:hypothetical protein